MLSVSPRPTRSKAQIREDILAATRRIAAAEGWKAVSMRRLAQEIAFSAPVIYEHFRNKEALMLEVALTCCQELQIQVAPIVAADLPPRECVLQVSQAWASYALHSPDNYALITGQLPDFPWHAQLRAALLATLSPVREAITRILPWNEDPDPYLHEWMALVHGFIQLRLSHIPQENTDETLARVERGVRRFVDGL